jgi:hypothetical protein
VRALLPAAAEAQRSLAILQPSGDAPVTLHLPLFATGLQQMAVLTANASGSSVATHVGQESNGTRVRPVAELLARGVRDPTAAALLHAAGASGGTTFAHIASSAAAGALSSADAGALLVGTPRPWHVGATAWLNATIDDGWYRDEATGPGNVNWLQTVSNRTHVTRLATPVGGRAGAAPRRHGAMNATSVSAGMSRAMMDEVCSGTAAPVAWCCAATCLRSRLCSDRGGPVHGRGDCAAACAAACRDAVRVQRANRARAMATWRSMAARGSGGHLDCRVVVCCAV